MTKILSLYLDHDGCATYVDNNKVIFHTQLDRYNKIKHCPFISKDLLDYFYEIPFDKLIITCQFWDYPTIINSIFHTNKRWLDKLQKVEIVQYGNQEHHLFHAYEALILE